MILRRFIRNAFVLLRWWSWCMLIFLSAACVVLLAVRWAIKDRWDAISIVYYASPAAVVMALLIGLALVWALLRKWSVAIGFSLSALVLLFSTVSIHPFTSNKREGRFCVLLWNPAGRLRDVREIVEVIRIYNPDMIGLVEGGGNSFRNRERWAKELPGYELSGSNRELVLLSKRAIHSIATGRAGSNGTYRHVRTQIGEGRVNVILADIQSDPLRSRRQAIEELTQKAADARGPVILMGDFNTPGDSVHFDALRDTFENAFDVAGNDYSPTWPLPVPLLQIDHVWVRGLRVNHCEHAWAGFSDHRPVVVYLTLEDVE